MSDWYSGGGGGGGLPTDPIVIGTDATANGYLGTVMIGVEADTYAAETIAIGQWSGTDDEGDVALGVSAQADNSSTSVGYRADAGSYKGPGTAVGKNARATGNNSVAIGESATADGFETVAVGRGAKAPFGGVAIGTGVQSNYSGASRIGGDSLRFGGETTSAPLADGEMTVCFDEDAGVFRLRYLHSDGTERTAEVNPL